MSELIILGYADHDTAERAFAKVLDLQRDFVVGLTGLAVVRMDEDGKKHVDTPSRLTGVSAASGAVWGVLLGVLFLVPAVGLVLGGAIGALTGRMGQAGLDRGFRSRVDALLEPGKACVVILAHKITEDKFAAAMGEFGGTVLQTSLSEDDEKQLTGALDAGA